MKQRYTNLEIAKAAYCKESTVKKAVERGLGESLEELLGWVLMQRLKQEGLSGLDGLISRGVVVKGTEIKVPDKKEELEYEPDYSQVEGEW